MTELRVSGLASITTDTIGACAILLRHNHPADALPEHPTLTDQQRTAFLRRLLDDVDQAGDSTAKVRALCELAAAAGMWTEYIDSRPAPKAAPERRPAPKLIRPGSRKPSDPGIDFTDEDW